MTTTKSRGRADASSQGTGQPRSEELRLLQRDVPGSMGYTPNKRDARPLRPGEKERLVGLLSGGEPETRYAAAYVVMALGIMEAVPLMAEALEKRREENDSVREIFKSAIRILEQMKKSGKLPKPEGQLMKLLQMREGSDEQERLFAQIIIERADIKYGTATMIL